MHDFNYQAPTSLAEALALHAQAGSGGRFLAGGTDLFLAMEHGSGPVTCVIDLKHIPALKEIEIDSLGRLTLGALATMAEVERHPEVRAHWQALAEAAAVVGGPPVRNRATIGGNICNASPAADTSVALLALGAEVVVDTATGGERERPLSNLWESPRHTTLAHGEVLRMVHLPQPPANSGSAFQRVTRAAMDIAIANAAARVTLANDNTMDSLVVALGAVAPTVITVPGMDQLLGYPCDCAALDQVEEMARDAAQPITDHRASADYRRDMAGVLARRAVETAVARADHQPGEATP